MNASNKDNLQWKPTYKYLNRYISGTTGQILLKPKFTNALNEEDLTEVSRPTFMNASNKDNLQWKNTSKYLSNHWSELSKILNLSLGDLWSDLTRLFSFSGERRRRKVPKIVAYLSCSAGLTHFARTNKLLLWSHALRSDQKVLRLYKNRYKM